MVKNYRLKITWSNSNSEYIGSVISMEESYVAKRIEAMSKAEGKDLITDTAIYYGAHIRKLELEEVKTDQSRSKF